MMALVVEFGALEYHSDEEVRPAGYRFEGDVDRGWVVHVDSETRLELGAGYRLLRSERCGVCSTDLARAYLPFRLPQVTGHEVVAVDEGGRRFAVEINASHAARGVQHDCSFCRDGLANHCPERLVLGIHDLPGGFGPYLLAPVGALHEIADEIDADTGTLIEPLAAALHGVTTVRPGEGQRITVLGPRKLGMLTVAALAAYRAQRNVDFHVSAISRRRELLDLARELGADSTQLADEALESADVVVDTTGSPEGLETAIRLARSEVHLKSTHGRPAAGLANLTALVVDELSLERGDGGALNPAEVDTAIRPEPGRERSAVGPRGVIRLAAGEWASSELCEAIVERELRLTSSRCGDFRAAIALIESSPRLLELAGRMVTHRFPASELGRALETARTPACIKAIVEHDVQRLN